MPDAAPLTSNEKALAISVLVVGGLVALFTLFTMAGAAYVLATGRVMGGQASQAITQSFQKNPEMKQVMERQLAAQAEVQLRWAPLQLASEGLYFVAVAGMMLFAIFALRSGGHRARLGQLALLASAVRVGVGVVTFMLTSELMRAATGSMMAAMSQGRRSGLSPEKTEELERLTSGAMAGLSAASAGCMALIMCVYFAVVGFVFLAAKKSPSPAAP